MKYKHNDMKPTEMTEATEMRMKEGEMKMKEMRPPYYAHRRGDSYNPGWYKDQRKKMY